MSSYLHEHITHLGIVTGSTRSAYPRVGVRVVICGIYSSAASFWYDYTPSATYDPRITGTQICFYVFNSATIQLSGENNDKLYKYI